jgi:hypothetical protein
MRSLRLFGAVLSVLFVTAAASADVKVAFDRNDPGQATADFKFEHVPSPSKLNAATNAKFTMVDGDNDDNGGDLEVLHDGKLPATEDEPTSNFFFRPGIEGGRIAVDLGSAIDVKRINTYSWHPSTRAPQVYSVYASDGSGADFNASPGSSIDPEKCGWKLIAKVDTHPATGEPGGQYGVSISDSNGSLGKYRFVLFAISRTEANDDFGNTFFSEINIIDASELLGNAPPPGDRPGVKLVQIDGGKYSATIDTTETPDLTEWANKKLAPVVVQWYPQLVRMLPSPGYAPPTHFSITFRKDKKGVADTSGTRINCAAGWFRTTLDGEARGAIVHEMVHVVQQYGAARRTNPHPNRNPGWLVEGIPDYIRWYKYEPESNGAAIGKRGLAEARYDGSYRISANFLHWAVQKYDPNLIQKLNTSMREGTYSDSIWKTLTGKTVQDLDAEWKADLS